MGKLVLSHVKMMSSISSIKLVRNKSLVDIIVEVHLFDASRRSREGAWIEILIFASISGCSKVVAPARERGLKFSLWRIR